MNSEDISRTIDYRMNLKDETNLDSAPILRHVLHNKAYVYSLIIVFPELKWPPFFAYYSLMVILIEK